MMKKLILFCLLFISARFAFAQTPVFSSSPATNASVGTPYNYTAAASDGINTLSYTVPTRPNWLTVSSSAFASSIGAISNPFSLGVTNAGVVYVGAANPAGSGSGYDLYKIDPGAAPSLLANVALETYDLLINGNYLYVPQYDGSDGATSGILRYDITNMAAGPTTILSGTDIMGLKIYNGDLYAAAPTDGKILKINLSTNAVTDLNVPISSIPVGIAFDLNGNLLITSYASDVLQIWNGIVLTNKTLAQIVFGIDTDASGNVYFASAGGGQVLKYAADLNTFATFTDAPTTAFDIAVTPSGRIFFGETDLNKIVEFKYGAPTLSGTPTSADIGSNPVSIQASNGTTTSTQNFNINVITTNAPGNALSLDGANDLISVPASPSFNFGTGNLTLEAWINTSYNSGNAKVLIGNLGAESYWFGLLNQHLTFYINGGNTEGTSIITDGKWHHVVGTRQAGLVSLYIDGKLETQSANPNSASPGANLIIGDFSGDGTYAFPGKVDEVRVYNEGLTAAQVTADMFNVSPALPANLVAYYDFDSGTAGGSNAGVTTLVDKSGNGHNGTLTNFALTGSISNWVASFAMTPATATAATNLTGTAFNANWQAAPYVANGNVAIDGYKLDVATDVAFTSILPAYNGIVVPAGTLTSQVTGLAPSTTYYYRVSTFSNTLGMSGPINVITVTTPAYTPPGNQLDFSKALGNSVPVNSTTFPSGNGSYTIEAWINPNSLLTVNNGGIIGWGNYGAVNEVNALRFGGGPGNYIIHNYWWGNDLSAPIADVSGQWTHIAATFDNASGVRSIYINGQLAASDNPSTAGHNVPSTNIAIGKTVGNEYFDGKIDEVRVYTSALTQANVQADMYNTTPVDPANLVAYYNFDQGVAGGNNTGITSLKNSTPATNKGTLNNFTLTGTASNFVGASNLTMEVPVASAATNITAASFSANWAATTVTATQYYLDVATDPTFGNILSAYNNKSVTALTDVVTGLVGGNSYYYRVRANNEFAGTSSNSNVISVTLNKTPQAITLAATDTKTYGDADYTLAASSTNSTLPLTYTTSDASVATISSAGLVHLIKAGTVTFTVNQAGDANYQAAPAATQTLTIGKKALTITASASNKVYDGLNTATVVLSGNPVNGDTFAYTYTSATFPGKAVGNNLTVTVAGISIPAAHANNYTFNTSATTTASITAFPLTVTATGINKVYDGSTSALVTLADNRIAGDNISINAVANFSNPNIGTGKPVSVTGISLTSTDATNYTVNTTAATTANITSAPITVTATAGQSKVYGTTDPVFAYTSTALASGDSFTGTLARAAGTNVGSYAINLGTLTAGSNYTITFVQANFAITAKPVTVTVTAGQSKVYGSVDPVFTYTFSPALVSGDTFSGALARAAGENVGTYAINQGNLALSSNYSITFVPANFSITAKAIAVTADVKTKFYGSADPALTYTFTPALVSGDVFTGILSRTAGENVGAYSINKNTLALSSNYTLTYTAANLNITPKALTITADNKTKVQGTANPALTASYSGFANGDTNTALLTQPALSTTATNASVQGSYPILISGATSNNYAITFVNGTLSVTGGTPTGLSLAAATLFENGPAGTLAGTLSSTSNDPAATFTYTLVSGTGSTDNASFSISGNQLLSAQSFDFETKNSYSVRVRTTTQYGLFLEQTFTLNVLDVNEAPTLNAIADAAICTTTTAQNIALSGISAGPETAQTTTLSVSSSNSALFNSLTVTGSGATGTLSYQLNPGASGTATVTVTVQDNGGTANGGTDTFTRTFSLNVNALPTVLISSDKGTQVNKGEVVTLTATGGTSYVWANANGIIGAQNTAVLTVRPAVTTTYTVTATNVNGCSTSSNVTITPLANYMKLKISNLLTPNGDGFNDKWTVESIDLYPNNEVKVFDKAGKLVFTMKNYNNNWDGTFNGSPLAENTYYYIVDFGPGVGLLKGFITIVR